MLFLPLLLAVYSLAYGQGTITGDEIILKLKDGTTIRLDPSKVDIIPKGQTRSLQVKPKKAKEEDIYSPPKRKRSRRTAKPQKKTEEEINYEQNLSRFYELQTKDQRKNTGTKEATRTEPKVIPRPKNRFIGLAGLNNTGVEIQQVGLGNGGTEVQIRQRQVIVLGFMYSRSVTENISASAVFLSNQTFLLGVGYER